MYPHPLSSYQPSVTTPLEISFPFALLLSVAHSPALPNGPSELVRAAAGVPAIYRTPVHGDSSTVHKDSAVCHVGCRARSLGISSLQLRLSMTTPIPSTIWAIGMCLVNVHSFPLIRCMSSRSHALQYRFLGLCALPGRRIRPLSVSVPHPLSPCHSSLYHSSHNLSPHTLIFSFPFPPSLSHPPVIPSTY